ncbi:aldo/keto reductase [Roseisolibacter sp. H3M3-2]|uniref:aldo/keto reductase n=1 Tax=Roseisolibacter sp. H3M3-2 TaxID=3031323 RepID=UPI0023DCBB49|nr:aldo/keto reductase [Roseisolibacter sp. H3M3-2]MDF1506292.1 aldo/keto reductase [Roseisolibacter sp. H3M3-2]
MDRRTFVHGTAATLAGAALPTAPAPMLARPIPRTGEPLPVVGLGTWQTFDPPRRSADALARLERTLRTLHGAGGRVVDSSPMYGASEATAGELAERAGLGDALFWATKVWTRGEAEGVRQMEESLRLLRRPRLDLMQVHNLVDWRTHLRTLRRWRDDGRVRLLGVTHYQTSAFAELEAVVARERIDVVQLPYSVALRDAEQRLLPAAHDAGVAVLVNLPFGGGGLLRRLSGEPLPPAVRAWAASWPQALLKFVLAHPAVTCVIPGTSNPEHMADNAGAGSGRLPDQKERGELLRALEL